MTILSMKTTTTIAEADVDVFRALCALRGRRPHELASELVADALRDAQADPHVREFVRNVRRFKSPLRIVSGDR